MELWKIMPHVRDKALYFVDQPYELTRWQEAGNEKSGQWKATLTKLKNKLNSEQPPEKKIYKYRLYKCEWKLGDCFAYQFKGEYAKEKGYEGKYIVFRKVTEYKEHPGHILPGVKLYCATFDSIPKLEDLKKCKYLRTTYVPEVYKKYPNDKKCYDFILGNTSKRVIPKDLIYLGNIGRNDLIPYDENVEYTRGGVGWLNQRYGRNIELQFITFYEAWKDIENEEELGVD